MFASITPIHTTPPQSTLETASHVLYCPKAGASLTTKILYLGHFYNHLRPINMSASLTMCLQTLLLLSRADTVPNPLSLLLPFHWAIWAQAVLGWNFFGSGNGHRFGCTPNLATCRTLVACSLLRGGFPWSCGPSLKFSDRCGAIEICAFAGPRVLPKITKHSFAFNAHIAAEFQVGWGLSPGWTLLLLWQQPRLPYGVSPLLRNRTG